ncbi:MAG: hydrogenase maturation nickel metallochaperone HypA [Bacteroidota bacterium]
MHELSIATSLVASAEEAARAAGARRVLRVHLRLGALSGVVRHALDFAYAMVIEGTLLEGSELVVQELPVVVYCATCEAEQTLPTITCFRCPTCDTPTPDVRQGREMEIDHLDAELSESPPPPPSSGDGQRGHRPMPVPPWRRG